MAKAPAPPTTQENPQTPPTPAPLAMEKFQGLFTSTTRPGVREEQCWWIDGYMPLGEMDLRTLPGVGPTVYSSGGNRIVSFGFANIGTTPIAVVFLSNGAIVQVNTNTGATVSIAPAATITNPSPTTIGMSQYGSQYVLIVAQQTNGYWIWDGTTLFSPGGPAPGGGTMPTAIGGSSIETFTGRVWIANGATITFSVAGSLINFASGSGGGNFTSTDSFLRIGYTQLIQTNGFLYLIGDSSINYISGVQTSGSPPVTTFTNQNADPEVGTPYAGTVDVFGRNIVFANAWGAHVSYGSAVTKISDALDGFYASVPNFGGLQLSAAKAIIYNKRIWMLLATVIDQFTGQQRNKLLMWNGQAWWASEQDITLTYIQHQEINSLITAWGTDGTNLVRLFQQPSAAFTKRVMSKFWTAPIGYQMEHLANRFWAVAQYYNTTSPNVTLFVESENAAALGGNSQKTMTPTVDNSVMSWTTLVAGVPTPMLWTTLVAGVPTPMVWATIGSGIVVFDTQSVAQRGRYLGFTLQTNSADMAWISAMLSPAAWAYKG